MSQKRRWESSTLWRGSISSDVAPGRGGAARWCTGMQTRPSARDPDRVPLDLFAVNEIKGPIIEFLGKLLPLRPGSGLFSHTRRVSPESWPLISLFLTSVLPSTNKYDTRKKEIV